MSSNLVKQFYTILPEEKEKRVIDNNDRIRRRLAMLSREQGGSEDGFVSGLAVADVVEVPEDATGNVIKAQDEAKEILEQARAEAETIRAEAQAEANQIRLETQKQAEIEKQIVLDQAKQQGYDEGMARAQAHEKAMEQEYLEKARSLEGEYQRQIDVLEPAFVDTITGIYEHVFHVELSSYREILTALISDALHKLEGSRNFMIHVSKEDYPYVSLQKKQMLAGTVWENVNVDVVEDGALGKNACMIETENGIFDCGLDTQLSEIRKKLALLSWSNREKNF
ncbi:FliH/SctL family protein [uncultured Acetatifactor sp.]|uniref:FliH/SctL family protein n=1 Tax=uncultured Acetatifactor sp. TaxID=1671927 RepID=UPI0026394FED|nr:FliH/SctL family protein [uncultured Acetatifactor sp.]